MKITKKLRDVTKEELRNYCEGKIMCPECFLKDVRCRANSDTCWVYHKDLYSDKFLDQTIEVETTDILTKEEKEYLRAVIKPFRDRIVFIKKIESDYYERCVICICYRNGTKSSNTSSLPDFNKNKMYVGMEENKPYKLEELGL